MSTAVVFASAPLRDVSAAWPVLAAAPAMAEADAPDTSPGRPPVEVAADPIGRRAPSGLPCQVHDPDLWFAEAPDVLELAKELCAGCPAQQMCLAGALDRREPCGVWGGQIFHRGHIVNRKRPRGRPPKDSAPVLVWG